MCGGAPDRRISVRRTASTRALDGHRSLQEDGRAAKHHSRNGSSRSIIGEMEGNREDRTRIFLSHAHEEQALAKGLITLFVRRYEVPSGRGILATSVQGHSLGLRGSFDESLRKEIGGTDFVLALLSPVSLSSSWVNLELGGAWVLAKKTVVLLAGEVYVEELPLALQRQPAYDLKDAMQVTSLVRELGEELGWKLRDDETFEQAVESVCRDASALPTSIVHGGFARQKEYVGENQRRLLYMLARQADWQHQETVLGNCLECVGGSNREAYYRLEQLHLLGLVRKRRVRAPGSGPGDRPAFEYSIAPFVRKLL